MVPVHQGGRNFGEDGFVNVFVESLLSYRDTIQKPVVSPVLGVAMHFDACLS